MNPNGVKTFVDARCGRAFRRACLLPLFFVLVWIAAFQFGHRTCCGHYAPLGLHVDALSWPGSIGIPGQTMLYRAEATNFGLWPISVAVCEYTTDALQREAEFAYGVQRWDSVAKRWQVASVPSRESFCQPVPLGRFDTHVRSRFIWPSQTETLMEFEALGAWDDFRKGDVARFVLFRTAGSPLDWDGAVPSDAVRIQDESVRTLEPFRLRH